MNTLSLKGQFYDCSFCGQSVYRTPAQVKGRKNIFCSVECSQQSQRKRIITQCVGCNKDFEVKAYRLTLDRLPSKLQGLTCSHKCKQIALGGGSDYINCDWCDKKFKRGASAIVKRKRHFCSTKCMGNWQSENIKGTNSPSWKEPIRFQCEHCHQNFERKPWYVNTCNGKMRFCSRECFELSGAFVGEKSTSYLGGKLTYRGRNWIEARDMAINRDRGTCQSCGKIEGQSISVHHIIPFKKFDSSVEANKLENLVCLCQSCHMKIEPRKQ